MSANLPWKPSLRQARAFLLVVLAVACATVGFGADLNNVPPAAFQRVEIDPQPPRSPYVKLAGDFDGDGTVDIAIGGAKGPLVWYANPGWRKVVIAPGGWQTVGGAVGDVDGDGDLDLVPGAQVWFENPRPLGDPAKDPWPLHRIGDLRSHDVALADLDRDGRLDLVARDQSGFKHNSGNQIHLWRQAAPDRWEHHAFACPHGEGLALADLDRDGDVDIIIGGWWFENPGRIAAEWPRHAYAPGWTWGDAKVAVGDFNGDGRPDVVLAPAEHKGQSYRIAWYEAPPDPRTPDWPERIVVPAIEAVIHALQAADMNGDDAPDIVLAHMHQGAAPQEVAVFLNGGQGRAWTKHVAATTGSHDILTADFNGDGRPDILGANHAGPHQPVEVWLNRLPGPAARGPLRVHPDNPRYLSDGGGRAVYLTGSHTWNSLVDLGRSDPPEAFDFTAYLDFLDRHGHNFIRLWTWDSATWDTRSNGKLGKDYVHVAAPLPWKRTGPGVALDGRPRFDLQQFDPAYFARLRQRVSEAGQRGLYVSVMLFEGWGLMHGNRGRAAPAGWAWRAHPFHLENNVNGVDAGTGGDGLSGAVHSLQHPAVTTIQAAYLRHVVDTVNDLDNVLYEVINEGGGKEWDWWVARTVQDYERTKPKQHLVGITGHGAERLDSMLASPAAWISPGRRDGFGEDPPAWSGQKVSLLDTDHIWGVGGNVAWVWRSFLRGHNPIFMDPYDGSVLGTAGDPRWEPIRQAMGHTLRLARRINLVAMTPQDSLATTGYCLAAAGSEYLVYLPGGGTVTVDLAHASGRFAVAWVDGASGRSETGEAVEGGAPREFLAPFAAHAVLHLRRLE